YFVTSNLSNKITRSITEISPIRQLADVETISSDSLDIIEDYDSLNSGWTSETSPIVETNTPRIIKKKIQVHELYAQPKATQKLIDDASIDIEKWLGEKLIISFANMENNAFINGDGEGKPRGLLSYPDGRGWGEIEQIKYRLNSTITAEALFDLYFALKEQYVNRASFLMHKTTIQKVRMLKDKNNQYIWYPGLDRASPATLLGIPVKSAVDMPVADDNNLTIAIADFKSAYKIVDRVGIKTLRDPFTDKPFVKFYTTKRVGGDVANYEAIKILNCTNSDVSR
ncbi:phage major capsid protein, partial [bacterium]